jgi:hypothetical protein
MRLTLMAVSFAFATATTAFAQTTIQTFSPLVVGEYCSAKVASGSLFGFYQSSGLNCYGPGGPNGQILGRGDAVAACRYVTKTDRVIGATRGANDALTCEFIKTEPGTVIPTFYVTHVIYAPPGDSSEVSYSSGNVLGSNTSTSRSFKVDVNVTAKTEAKFLGNGGSISVSVGAGWGNTSRTSTDVTVTTQVGIVKPGAADFVDHAMADFQNHGSDEIWFLVKPRMDFQITPAWGSIPQQMEWSFATQSFLQYFVYVRELRDPSIMPANVKSFLDSQGITAAYYSQLLAADPLAAGLYPNTAMDAARFDYVGQVPYVPPARPQDTRTRQTFSLTRATTNTSTVTRESTYTTSIAMTGSVSFLSMFKGSLTGSTGLTFSHSTSKQNTTGSSQSQAFTLTQPPYGYAGPTVARVYLDKVWKTFVFSVDYF